MFSKASSPFEKHIKEEMEIPQAFLHEELNNVYMRFLRTLRSEEWLALSSSP